MKIFKTTITIGIALALVAVSGSLLAPPAAAAGGGLEFQTIGTHPEAAQQRTIWGTELSELAVDSQGNIIAGYGDWNDNTGPIVINPFNPTTRQFGGVKVSVPSEALHNLRKINGKIYAPWIDPQGSWTDPTSGYAVGDSNGTWSNVGKVGAIHVFDITARDSTGQDLMLVGAATTPNPDGSTGGKATAWRSTDGGETWQVAYSDISTPSNAGEGYERYYWTAALNGKVYMQARSVVPQPPMRIFDGTNWTNGPAESFCSSASDGSSVVVFANKIVCAGYDGVQTMDESGKVETAQTLGSGNSVRDWYVDGATLYALTYGGEVFRTTDLRQWTQIAAAPAGSASVLVLNDRMYLGASDARIMESTTPVSETDPITYNPEITAVEPNTLRTTAPSQTVTVRGIDFLSGAVVTLDGESIDVSRNSTTELTMTVDPSQYSGGAKDIVVTNPDGSSATSTLTFVEPEAPWIEKVSVSRDPATGRQLLKVNGKNFLSEMKGTSYESSVWVLGLYKRLVALNGKSLPFCATNEEAGFYRANGINQSLYSTAAPCYRLVRYNTQTYQAEQMYLKDTEFVVELPANYDTNRRGGVQLLAAERGNYRISSSQIFSFGSVAPGPAPGSGVPAGNAPLPGQTRAGALADTGVSALLITIISTVLIMAGSVAGGILAFRRQRQ